MLLLLGKGVPLMAFFLFVQDIIYEILAGNRDRFRVIIQEFGDDLLRLAYHFLHDWFEAEEVTQLTFIACYRRLKRYDPRRPFRPWLFRIHLNLCKTAAKRRLRHTARFLPADESHDQRAHENRDSAVGDEELILREIHALTPKQTAAFVLLEIENMSTKEAAEILLCSESTVRVHLARAKKTLRERLKRYGIESE
jgi:RNA polymerase sigma-70 factor (ECF subfamily)